MYDVIMPKLGLTMESGTIEKWHKKEGDKVKKGDVLFEVMTDKVTLEVESYYSGYLKKILSKEGEEVPVKEVLAYIGEKDEKISSINKKSSKQDIGRENDKKLQKIRTKAKKKEKVKDTLLKEKIKISPLARKLAKEMDVNVARVEGTGPSGRITKKDILKYSKDSEEEDSREPVRERLAAVQEQKIKIRTVSNLKGTRKIIAERMSYSKSSIPHIVLNSVANATSLIKMRESLKDKVLSKYKIKITYTDFLLKICAVALSENLELNSTLKVDNYIIYEDVNMGVAVSSKGGLVVPTIFNCDSLGILEISKKRKELVERARDGKLKLDEIQNGTFTMTNLGMFGIRSFSAIINPPQSAILAVGEIYNASVFINDKIEKNSFINLTLSCDHRIIDGEIGSRFLKRVVELIESPEILVI